MKHVISVFMLPLIGAGSLQTEDFVGTFDVVVSQKHPDSNVRNDTTLCDFGEENTTPITPGGSATHPTPKESSDRARKTLVNYTPSAPESLSGISVEAVQLSNSEIVALADWSRDPAPFGSRTLIFQRADTMQPAPWTTQMFVVDGRAERRVLRFTFRDHASYGVAHTWLNDRLLFVRIWWGRIVSSEVLLNVETGTIVLAEDANYLGSVLPPGTSPR